VVAVVAAGMNTAPFLERDREGMLPCQPPRPERVQGCSCYSCQGYTQTGWMWKGKDGWQVERVEGDGMTLSAAVADHDRWLEDVHGWERNYFSLGPRGERRHQGVKVD
jgi:hypothetical protein